MFAGSKQHPSWHNSCHLNNFAESRGFAVVALLSP